MFGPVTHRPVPWSRAIAWAQAHLDIGRRRCGSEQDWNLAILHVRGGWAYVDVDPRGRIVKIDLSGQPIPWD